MKPLMLLKLMIDLFFFGSIISFLLMIIIISRGEFNIGGQKFENLDPSKIVFVIFTMLRPVSFFLAVFHIKLLAANFIKGKIFTNKTSRNLKWIGLSFIIYSISESIAETLHAHVFDHGDTILSGNFMGFNSAWFQFTLGLLFIFMDGVFREAKEMKQENKLTI